MPLPFVQRKCATCGDLFDICASCYRGQAYCSPPCRGERQQRLARARSSRYRRTAIGLNATRLRQARYRKRVRTGQLGWLQPCKNTPPVTHATSNSLPDPIPAPDRLGLSASRRCCLCKRVIKWHMQDSPRPATDYRRLHQFQRRRSVDRKRVRNQNQAASL